MTGGSAGAICWFDGGHSDSMDGETFKEVMLTQAHEVVDESSAAPTSSCQVKSWEYVRCPSLGIFPGLVCPHADKVQSNGILRAIDFDNMMLRHHGERGICIDHFAALCVDGEDFWVLSLPGRPGSVLSDRSYSPSRAGAPGIWIKDVVDGKVITSLCQSKGKLTELLRSAIWIVEDPRLSSIRIANPL